MDGQYWKGDWTMSTNEWLLTSDFWQFLEPWHGRWYEYEICIASCTDNTYDLENERWLLGDMFDHVGIHRSRVAKGLSAFNVGLVSYETLIFIGIHFTVTWQIIMIDVDKNYPYSTPRPLMNYWLKDPGHQQQWYWPSYLGIFWPQL